MFLSGKRVFLVTHDLSLSGAPLLLLELAKHLRNRGAEIRVGTLKPHRSTHAFALAGFKVEESANAMIADAEAADIIIANTCVASDFVRRLMERDSRFGSRLIWWVHENDIEAYGNGMELLREVGAVAFDCESSRQTWRLAGYHLPLLNEVLLPGVGERFFQAGVSRACAFHPAWLDRFLPQEMCPKCTRKYIRSSFGLADDDFLFLITGTVAAHKGQESLAAAWRIFRDEHPGLRAKLMIVGFLDFWDARQFWNRRPPAEAALLDPTLLIPATRNLLPYYVAADAFIMNSQGRRGENLGLVTIEAMATKLPVLGTDAGGTPEIVIDGKTGFLHPLGSAGQAVLSQNMARLVYDKDHARGMGEAGHARAKMVYHVRHFEERVDRFLARFLAQSTGTQVECSTTPRDERATSINTRA